MSRTARAVVRGPAELSARGRGAAAFEAASGWSWLADLLEDYGFHAVAADHGYDRSASYCGYYCGLAAHAPTRHHDTVAAYSGRAGQLRGDPIINAREGPDGGHIRADRRLAA